MIDALAKIDMQPGLARCPICDCEPYCERVEPWPVKTHGPAPWAIGCYRMTPFEHFVGVNGDDHAEAVKNWNAEAAKAAALSQLAAMATECSEQGWDGDAAAAIDPVAILSAKRFVRALPDGVPLPEFAPEPDGSISLDWIRSRNRLLSLSIGRSSRLAYAWLDGADKGHAVARFDGQNVPPRVLEAIKGIVGQGHVGQLCALVKIN